jgi:hypothetical protein
LAAAFIFVNFSWAAAVLPLPWRLSTNARGVVPVELVGTCTMTVLVKPFTLSDSVVEPGDVAEQPLDVAAAATGAVAALNGTRPSATTPMVVLTSDAVATWITRSFMDRPIWHSLSLDESTM